MASFSRTQRQRIIDDYLTASGSNQFNPAEFIDWLAEHPGHDAYPWFYGTDDATAAREHRIGMARSMANGLRITAQVSAAPQTATSVTVAVREFPAMISPMAGRKDGGGYQPFHPDDPAMVAELRRQGAQALRGWLARYRGVAELSGVDVQRIEEIVNALGGTDVADAA